MKKRTASALLAAAMTIISFTSCSSSPKSEAPSDGSVSAAPTVSASQNSEEKTLVWNLATDPETWDPTVNGNSDGGHICFNIFEGLMRETKNGLEPGVAESYTLSDDKTVYTFKLRENAKWSDGKPLVANDFVYSWQRVCDPVVASVYSYIMTPYIKGADDFLNGKGTKENIGVKAIDDKTLEVTLVHPVPYFLNLTAYYTYMPVRQDMVEKGGEGWEKKVDLCVSNGPFKITEYKNDLHIILEKNENYWNQENIKLNKIKAIMLNEATTAFQGYEKGEIQVLDAVPQEEIANLKAKDPNFTTQPIVSLVYFACNYDKEPTNNPLVRKALSAAIDRTALVEKVTGGGEMPATGLVPPTLSYSDGSHFRKLDENEELLPEFGIDPTKADVELAKKLLTEAGYPDGKGFPEIELLYSSGETNQKISEAIQQMWKDNLNINIKLRNEDVSTFYNTCDDGNYNVARCKWTGDFNDPITMLDIFTSYSGINNTQWRWQAYGDQTHDTALNPSNKLYDEAIEKSINTIGADRDNWMKKAEQLIIGDEMVIIPLYYPTTTILIDSSVVEGAYVTVMGNWKFDEAHFVV